MPHPPVKKATQSERVGSVWIRKRAEVSPYWLVRWREGDRHRERSLQVTDKRAARRQALEWSRQLEAGHTDAASRKLDRTQQSFAALIEEFKQHYTGWSDLTRRKNNGTLLKLAHEWGHLSVSRITTARIDHYLAQRTDLTAATVNRYLATLKSLFKCAINWGYTTTDPTARLRFRPEQARIPEALTVAQAEALLAQLRPFARDLSILALDTGMRASEIQRLRWRDIDRPQRTLTVRQSKSHNTRIIPLTRRVEALLDDLSRRGASCQPQDLVYPFNSIKKSLYRAGRDIGTHMHFHRFRHTYITWMLEAGVPINQVQYLAGHKDIQMTLRYDHPTLQRHRRATEALEDFQRLRSE